MKRQRFISQGALSRTFQAAAESWNRQDYAQYFELLERACRRDPANHGLLLELGSGHGKRHDYAAAERCCDQATWSTRIRGWYELGAILDGQGRYDEAMAAFPQAKAMIGPNAEPRLAAQRKAHERLKEAETEVTAAVLRRWLEFSDRLQPVR